ncbi:MAG: ATP-binding protein [Halanaerobiales bacterium]
MIKEHDLGWHPGNVCFGLSRIGYTPPSAICDIVDNSVEAKAKNIHIKITKKVEEYNNSRRNNVREYLIIDDGFGMNRDECLEALSLGSEQLDYDSESLSKFGLGLKSAGFSQGQEIQLISSDGISDFKKFKVDLTELEDKYFCTEEELTDRDKNLIDNYLSKKGTIVRLTKIRENDHPSIKSTIEELQYKLGVIYYYFLKDNELNIYLEEEKIEPFDVLFKEEADLNGKLDENNWKGRKTEWIQKPEKISLDSDAGIEGTIEVTQLPYPPIHDLDDDNSAKAIRDKYYIEAGNYGFYVYRNKRLISWAERFEIIPLDQDFYSFRGRILIDDKADDVFNIDVKKSQINLSEQAKKILDDLSHDYKRKSKQAWKNAGAIKKQKESKSVDKITDDIADKAEVKESLPGSIQTPQEAKEKKKRDKELQEELTKKLKDREKSKKDIEDNSSEGIIESEELDEELKGNDTEKGHERIFKVDNIEDNALWELYYDAEKGVCIRINKNHRFAKLIFEDNSENTDLQILMQLFMLYHVHAERHCQTNYQEYEREDISKILKENRRVLSEFLADLCRNKDINLPPLEY